MYRQLIQTLFKNMPNLPGNCILGLCHKLASVVSPIFIGFLINALATDTSASALATTLSCVVGCQLLHTLLGYIFERKLAVDSGRMEAAMRQDLFHKFNAAPLHEIDSSPPNTWAQKLSFNVGTVVNACRSLLNLTLSLLGYAAAALYILIGQSLYFLPILILMVLGSMALHRNRQAYITQGAGQLRRANYRFLTFLTDQIGVIPLRRIQQTGSAPDYPLENEKIRQSQTNFELLGIGFRFYIDLLTWCVHALLLSCCILLWWWGHIEVGGIVACHILLSQMSGGIFMVTDLLPMLDAGTEMVESLGRLPAGRSDHATEKQKESNEGISIKGVVYGWPGCSEPVLKGASLTAETGESICIFGTNGCGKSTLTKLLMNLYQATEGSCGHGYGKTGYVPHHTPILHDTLFENIRLQNPDLTEQHVEEVLKLCPIPGMDATKRLHETISPHSLSDGQKQCLGLARALIRHPSLLIIDEPTHSLDAGMKQCVYERLANVKRFCALCTVSHELPPRGLYDRFYLLHNGLLREQTYEEFALWLKKGGQK